MATHLTDQLVHIPADSVRLAGELSHPPKTSAVVVFAHGSGSSRPVSVALVRDTPDECGCPSLVGLARLLPGSLSRLGEGKVRGIKDGFRYAAFTPLCRKMAIACSSDTWEKSSKYCPTAMKS